MRLGRGLALAERVVVRYPWKADSPQLFILGLPRSGTTLVYQYVVHRLKVAYLTNAVGRRRASPCVTTALSRLRLDNYRSDFQSRYGKVDGTLAPREAGGVWARFFGYEGYVRADDLDASTVQTLQRTVFCTQRAFGGAPFVNKNVKHMLRLDALATHFPDSRFLVVQRDLGHVALSLLRARQASGDAKRWWSVKPDDHDEISTLSPAEQVARQVQSLHARLNAEVGALAVNRVHRVEYEAFCAEPETLIEELRRALGPVRLRNPPERCFDAARPRAQTDEELRLLELVESVASA